MSFKKTPLVSIIMPAFNAEKYIEYSIKSVLSQTYSNWELVIINDCSTDKTKEILETLIAKNKQIKYLENDENLGVSKTRNKGINLSNGEYIAFLDSDDQWAKNKLNDQIQYIQNTGGRFVFTGSSFINEKGALYNGVLNVPSEVDYNKLKKHNIISCSSVVVEKTVLENKKFQYDSMHEDYALWLEILKTGIIAYGIDKPLLTYRIHSNSKSHNKLKSLKMTYRVYRYLNINRVSSLYYLATHNIKAFIKYKKVHS